MPELGELIKILLLTIRVVRLWIRKNGRRRVWLIPYEAGEARQSEATRSSYLQSGLDVGKCGTSLLKEAVDDAPAKVTVVVIVHLKNLLKCALIDEILNIGELGRGRLGLWREVSESSKARVMMDAGRKHLLPYRQVPCVLMCGERDKRAKGKQGLIQSADRQRIDRTPVARFRETKIETMELQYILVSQRS